MPLNGTMPLPLAPSGSADQIAALTGQYENNKVRRNFDWATYLQDQGVRKFDPEGNKFQFDSRARNPYGAYQQIVSGAEEGSAAQGFGYTGRLQQLKADKPTFELKRGLSDRFAQKNFNEQDDYYALKKGIANEYRNAANWGVNQKYFRVPTAAEAAARRGVAVI